MLGGDKVYGWFAKTPRRVGVEKIKPEVGMERGEAGWEADLRSVSVDHIKRMKRPTL